MISDLGRRPARDEPHLIVKVKIPKLRWFLASLLLMATVINYTDRLTFSVVIPDMRRYLSLSDEDYAQIVSIFLFAYAIMYGVSGYVVDRLGTRKGFALFISSWSIAEILHGFAEGKWSLAAYRFLLGLAEPGNFPAATKATHRTPYLSGCLQRIGPSSVRQLARTGYST